jgi:L-2-hydroxyglutarate oxidase
VTRHDVAVIGGGIVGLAAAYALVRHRPGLDIVVLEKEPGVGRHQTGHNSGVIHAGIYYEPGSLKADFCRRGLVATKEFAAEHGIPTRTPGKLIVATTSRELERLRGLRDRARENRIDAEWLSAADIREREPKIVGLAALLLTQTGVIDFGRVARTVAEQLTAAGVALRLGHEVERIDETPTQVSLATSHGEIRASALLACAGLQADRVARMGGIRTGLRIVPFRGEYYELIPARSSVVQHLIYPVPDPELPFLGVHLSPTVDGRITVGPNAVLGLAREGYRRGAVDARDVRDLLTFPGAWRLARAHWRTGAAELRNSVSKQAYLDLCRKYCPQLELDDLVPHPAGIRAQAVARNGALVHDFAIERTDRSVHVLNAPSPAATSALPIGQHLAGQVLPLL